MIGGSYLSDRWPRSHTYRGGPQHQSRQQCSDQISLPGWGRVALGPHWGTIGIVPHERIPICRYDPSSVVHQWQGYEAP